jgi:HK97 family phage major capsid protein
MSMGLFELKQQKHSLMTNMDSLISNAERAGRALSVSESEDVDRSVAQVDELNGKIALIESRNTISRLVNSDGMILPGAGAAASSRPTVLSPAYARDFFAWMQSGGEKASAALYEGQGSAGGFAVPVTIDGQIVPLAPKETGVRSVATIIPTTNDLRIPRQTAASVAAFKAESGATANSFTETGPVLDQFTLSAFMSGAFVKMSFELAQDVPSFEAFAVTDLLNAQQQLEESWYVSGTGINQAQGLIGNVGVGVTEEPDSSGNLVSIDGTLDLVGSLTATYHEGASFLMNRLTSILIRKAARQANLFEPVFTRSGGQDYLHNYPVAYSAAMPVAARGATPILFGDFKTGYVIGQRGGTGINVKILDQPLALQGQIALLAYRRTDGRVRRPEAIQAYTIAAS